MRSPLGLWTVADYLEAEAASDIRHEYISGYVFAMVGASEAHNLIAGNLLALLRPHLRGKGCRVFMSDMKLKVKDDIFYYLDLLVTCHPQDNQPYFKTEPTLIIEVLSKTTETTDLREKLMHYQTLASLQEYVLVSQNYIEVEVYRRQPSGHWTVEVLKADHDLHLESVDLRLTMAEIYEDVRW